MLDKETLAGALDAFIAEGWITDDALMLKSGKEATAYRCAATPGIGAEFYVAKVYREQESRGFKNDAVYHAGVFIKDGHMRRAMANKSRVGREFQFNSWVRAEYATLRLLHNAGAGKCRRRAKCPAARPG